MKKIRILAAVLATLLLAELLSACGGKKGLFHKASGIDPQETIVAVSGQNVSAEEYLYWLAYECEKLTASRGTIQWDEVIEDDVTYGEYAKRVALKDVIQYAVCRFVAEKYSITLTQEDRETLQKNKEADIQRCGGKEGYLRHLAAMGISEATHDRINEDRVLQTRLIELGATKGSPIYPSEEDLASFSQGKEFATVRLIALPISGLDEGAREAQQAKLEDCVRQIREADDPCAKLAQLSRDLGQTDGETDQTLDSDAVDSALMKAVEELEEGEVSDVITTANAMCVALRRPLDTNAIARECFTWALVLARSQAKVEVSDSYKSLDAGKFYTALVELRKPLLEEAAADK